MEGIDLFNGIDIYLIDQLLKGRIKKDQLILDAGCGSGRNYLPFAKHGYKIEGFDSDESKIQKLKQQVELSDRVSVSSVEDFSSKHKYDFIICNAVLHFADSHEGFNAMFQNLASLLDIKGTLFIRMTSDIGQHNHTSLRNGRYLLPDGSERYLITRKRIDELCVDYNLKLIEPVKSLNVDGLRIMTTIVLKK